MDTPLLSHLLKLHSFFSRGPCNWWSQEAGSAPCGLVTGVQRVTQPLAAVDLDLRMLLCTASLCSSPLTPHIALLHRDYASGTTGHLGVSWALNEAHLFLSLVLPLPLSQPLFLTPTIPSSHIWPGSRTDTVCWEMREMRESPFAKCVSHDQSHKSCMPAKSCLLICPYDSIAISCLVAVFTCQALFDILQNSWPVHKFPCFTEMGFVRRAQLF